MPPVQYVQREFKEDLSVPKSAKNRGFQSWISIYATLSRTAFVTSCNVAHPARAKVSSNSASMF